MIADNLPLHKHPDVMEWVSRRRRLTLHFTPTYASWLNQIEIWFNIFARDVVKGGVWKSKKDLVDQIMFYIKRYNRDRAHPSNGLTQGKPSLPNRRPYLRNAALENLFRGESPLTKPEPIFKSPRNLRYMMTQKVRRDWHQATAVVATRPQQIRQTLLVTRTVSFSIKWSSIGIGETADFDQGSVPIDIVNRLTAIVVTLTLTANTSDTPLQAVLLASNSYFNEPNTISFAPGETGTKIFVFPPAVVADFVAHGRPITSGGIIIFPYPGGVAPTAGTVTKLSMVVQFFGT